MLINIAVKAGPYRVAEIDQDINPSAILFDDKVFAYRPHAQEPNRFHCYQQVDCYKGNLRYV